MLYKALRGIKSNKSGRPDPIPGKVSKEIAFELSPVITNASMVQGYVPVPLKQSELVPVPKCLPPKVVEQDLRPISVMPHIAKVMEGLTLDSLFMQVCDKLDTHQFALAGSPRPMLLFSSSKSSLRPLTKVTLTHTSSLLISVKVLI